MRWSIAPLILMTMVIGCDSPDTRYAELADRVVTEQSQQNAQAAKQTQQIAEASRQLVEADAQSRRELIEANERLQGEVGKQRLSVDQQRDTLESERREIASDRYQAPVVAGAINGVGLLIAMVLPLVVCIYLLRYLAGSPEPARELVEFMTEEFISEDTSRITCEEMTTRRLDE